MACDSIDKCTDGGLDFMREKHRLISHESIKIFMEVDCDASVVRCFNGYRRVDDGGI
jgi:hypothetical protein